MQSLLSRDAWAWGQAWEQHLVFIALVLPLPLPGYLLNILGARIHADIVCVDENDLPQTFAAGPGPESGKGCWKHVTVWAAAYRSHCLAGVASGCLSVPLHLSAGKGHISTMTSALFQTAVCRHVSCHTLQQANMRTGICSY